MEQLELPSEQALIQLQQMLDTPLENQASNFEVALLGNILQIGLQLLKDAGHDPKIFEVILFQLLKNAFVLGRSHRGQLS